MPLQGKEFASSSLREVLRKPLPQVRSRSAPVERITFTFLSHEIRRLAWKRAPRV